MEKHATEIPQATMYKFLTGAIVPRPIGWISTVSTTGQFNLAPFSFFNAVNSDPPHVMFCPNIRRSDLGEKDTLLNVRATGQFVVNIVTESLAEAMNLTAGEYPADVDEFVLAGITPVPSVLVRPPRIAESPIHLECEVSHMIPLGQQPGGGTVVIGQVIHVHIDDALLIDGDKIDVNRLQPLGRLAGSAYLRVTDLIHLTRPPSQIRSQT